MKGTVLGYNQAEGKGAISHSDGARIDFQLDAWRGERDPVAGMVVDFEIVDGVASEIYPISNGHAPLPGAQQGGQDTALLLGIFALVFLVVGILTVWFVIGYFFLLISAGLGLAAIITGKKSGTSHGLYTRHGQLRLPCAWFAGGPGGCRDPRWLHTWSKP